MLDWALRAAVVVALAGALAVAWVVVRPDGRWRAHLTDRFVYGVPWGTLVVVAVVLSVYLFVQGGWRHWSNPVVIPFRGWSYLYPTGMLTSGFSHASPGHLLGNLRTTLVLAPIAEYAWGHYPPTRGDDAQRTLDRYDPAEPRHSPATDWLGRPWVRALVVFPAVVLLVGLLAALFFLGPVIGFSGVVFAFGGFALVHYPVTTLVGLLLSSTVRVVYEALTQPTVTQGISGGAPSPPWWAEVAVQGHALGLLLGVLLGLGLLVHRDREPRAGRVFLATLVFATVQNLWAVYWFVGDGLYRLYRGVGILLVLVLVVLVTLAAGGSSRSIGWPDSVDRSLPRPRSLARGYLAVVTAAAAGAIVGAYLTELPLQLVGPSAVLFGIALATPALVYAFPEDGADPPVPSVRSLALLSLIIGAAILAGPAVAQNLVTVGDEPVPGNGSVSVADYEVTYAEDVRDRRIPVFAPAVGGEQPSVNTSGVIVVSEARHIWAPAVSRQFLASEGQTNVTLGGVGWRSTVTVERSGWEVVGNDSVYAVDLRTNGTTTRSFASGASTAEPRVANHTVRVEPAEDDPWFELHVRRGGEHVQTVTIPETGEDLAVGGVRITVENVEERDVVVLETDESRVRVAQAEKYR